MIYNSRISEKLELTLRGKRSPQCAIFSAVFGPAKEIAKFKINYDMTAT